MMVAKAKRLMARDTSPPPSSPKQEEKQDATQALPAIVSPCPTFAGVRLPPTHKSTSAVIVQLTIVSKNTSKTAHIPCSLANGFPDLSNSSGASASPWRTARLPSPASLENTPLEIPYRTALPVSTPAAPPAALSAEKASFTIRRNAPGSSLA